MPARPVSTSVLAVALTALVACNGTAGPARATKPVAASPAPTPTRAHPCGVSSTPSYRHVIWIWMENRSYQAVLGSGNAAPRLAAYARRCGVATDYHAVSHPSLPNYLAAVSGSTHGVSSDCDPAGCPQRHPSIFGQVASAGRWWRGYAESMRQPCDHASYGRYAARHNPAVYFPPSAAKCRRDDLRMGGASGRFGRALADDALPAFAFVTPNLCDDGHDCSTSTADTWLGRWLDRIVASPAYAAGRTLVVVTWDEGVGSDNHVATVVVGPTVPVGTRAGHRFTHYSLLRTTEELLGLHRLGKARTAASMRAAFHLG